MVRKSARLSTRSQNIEESKDFSSSRNSMRKYKNIVVEISSDSDSENNSDSEDCVLLNTKKSIVSSPRKHKVDAQLTIGASTPPKQRKMNKTEISNENSPTTPSIKLSNLSLNSPTAKKESLSRKTLFSDDIYQNAKRALHSTTPGFMPGRQKEFEELDNFITSKLSEKSSGSLYISGPPGTGKTASLTLILDKEDIKEQMKTVYVNCTSIKSSGAVFSRIIKELGLKSTTKSEKEYLNVIEKHFAKTKKTIFLVLDEMDQLESKNQSILYTIFEWPAKFTQNIILIGIANALDLTDRILPRLQARCELKPTLLHFAPYTKQQIVDIISFRLEQADALKVFSPAALQMLAGKVAAVSGDVRRALDIARRVIDMIDKDSKSDVLQSVENLDIDKFRSDVKKVDLKEVVGVLNKVYGTTQNLSDDCDNSFPLQQKIVICSLLLILQKGRSKDVTIGKLHDVYKKICTKRSLFSVDQAEFVSLCSLIETKGILRVSGKKEPRLNKVTLEWDQQEVIDALKDKVLISSILQDNDIL